MKEAFKDKEFGKPFTVYVVFDNMCGRIEEYLCEITKCKLFGIFVCKGIYKVKLYHKEESYYYELYNDKVDDYYFQIDRMFLDGDGSNARYAHGSCKSVYLDKEKALEEAKRQNSYAFEDAKYAKSQIERFENK